MILCIGTVPLLYEEPIQTLATKQEVNSNIMNKLSCMMYKHVGLYYNTFIFIVCVTGYCHSK